ncbi:max-binding protein MNT isoform X1 [Salmo salar]|uniref:Max-binding protein MNT n=2 Tax=Salmo salar TaxID=8030 RepID=A0A1S3SZW1_SALSA|nr:max-binding protein MNT-like isoform X1 [Salmo salar]|eukprot:XP_014069865.1 PREDICTED: max-binding protein MNT-like isoform X1 [Salmo salar]
MSIETLLEAAKFLELQAQQQQKAREENELREKLRLEQLSDHKRNDVTTYSSPIQMNHVTRAEESCPYSERCPAFVPPPLPPPSMTVIPIPMMTSNHTGLPPTVPTPSSTSLSPQAGAAPHLASPRRDPHSPGQGHQGQGVLLALSPQVKTDPSHHLALAQSGNHKQNHHHHHHLPQIVSPQSGNYKLLQKQQQQSPQLVQPYPGSIVSAPQPGPPQTPCGGQTSPVGGRGSPPDLDGKKRPGGAGTREVHNKLEKNRRAHLKECFDTLKRNIPNADEKKTSNLSVLRSALRYIQTLKRKEKEYEHEMERLAREKIATQQRLAELKNELSQWMNVMEIDRVLRQTFQPDDDQASTSTASEGEDIMDEENVPTALPTMPQQAIQPELCKTVTPITPTTSNLTQHISSQHKAQMYPQLHPHLLSALPVSATFSTPTSSIITTTPIQALLSAHTHIVTSPSTLFPAHTHMVTTPAHTHMVKAPSLQPTVIAHGSASHASVIQAVNHVIQAQTSSGGAKHLTHLAPSSSAPMQLAPGHHHHQPIGHITVHPVTHLGQHHLPTIYPQPVAITHTLNGTAPNQGTTTIMGKQMGVGAQVVAHHPQLLNPVTMVTMPSFPVSTLKLA